MGNNQIDNLIAGLTCDDVLKCQKARRALVDIGSDAVPALIEALKHEKQWVRWEAAKALSEIGDPRSIDALVNALTDQEFEIRWLAAEGLIKTGPGSIVPLLRALIDKPESTGLKHGAHHVFNDLPASRFRDILQPLIQAIEIEEPLHIPWHAKKALELIGKAR